MTVAALRGFTYRYPNAGPLALDNVDLAVNDGITLVAGASGSGKSSLLRVFNGLVPHFHGGTVSGFAEVCGRDVITTPTRVLATSVGFGNGMRYVGRAGAAPAGTFPIAPGLFPRNTEFLHSVRYLDVADGAIVMAPRMKELRYAKKVRWLSDTELKGKVAQENAEQAASPEGVTYFASQADRGVYNGQGWFFQGFIEAADGGLRPQSYEETVACVGCHGGIGATTDSTFSFQRKLPATSAARGWFHWTQHGLQGLPEPRRRDGRYEYALYLEANHAGDELRENTEVLERFFDAQGQLRPAAIARLRADIGTLLMPSPARAIKLDRAYMAIVREQSFVRGRDAVLAPTSRVYSQAPVGERTAIAETIAPP